MKVLIVAKTRRGSGACIGGIAEDGRSVRLVSHDAATNNRAGLEYQIGDVWEVEHAPDPHILPPHVENIIVLGARRLKHTEQLIESIHRFMPPVTGGPEKLFDGLPQSSPAGALYVCERAGLPSRSTMFWVPDQPLTLDCEGKRIRYRYPSHDGRRTLTFVGFQEPVKTIPAGTLLRVSLAHRWRPKDKPQEELRCYLQLSEWFGDEALNAKSVAVSKAPLQTAPAADLTRAREVLNQTFGFAEFQSVQADVIARVLQRLDTFVVVPTGGGKSLCYQLPALIFDGLTVVVSPLIALMKDQVDQLRHLAVPAAFLNSMVPHGEYAATMRHVREGAVKVLYLAPETLLRPETLLLLEQSNLACLAIDEAHCISEWGHDFRPEYRQIKPVRRQFPHAVCIALTATATTRVREDIGRQLDIAPEGEFLASFNRPNLFLTVRPRNDGLAQTLAFVEQHRGESGIIYCGKRQQTEELVAALNANGWPALAYHAGLDDDVRRRHQEQFIRDEVPLIVATVAFGMGINKSNVRFVLHYNLPKDIESYYQEIGRAGRDGLRANCLLLYSRADAMTIRHFIDEGAGSERAGRQARLNALMRLAETRECRRVLLLGYFGETLPESCGHCDNCVQAPPIGELRDVTAAAEKFLSCVKRTGEMFGPAHIIAVLRGSRSVGVLSRKHHRLTNHGVGKEHSTEEWRDVVREFIQLGLVEQDLQFGSVRLTDKGRAVLQGGEKVFVPVSAAASTTFREGAAEEHDRELFENLRQLRRQLATEANVPPYVIFSDRALIEMATHFPHDHEQFLAINGVGQAKLSNYGAAFLKCIRNYCEPRGITPKTSTSGSALTKGIVRPEKKRRFHDIGESFNSGQSIATLANRYDVERETIITNLARFQESGGALDRARLVAESRLQQADRERVFAAFERLGIDRLAPIHDALHGAIGYDELHLLRLCLRCEQG